MTGPNAQARRAQDQAAEAGDGRRLRSSRSRQRIVRAMFELIRSGDMSPNAARVAEAADVSLRTVFRHFEEIDSLYREMTAIIEADIRPFLTKPLQAAGWRARVDELVTRRTDIYERILPHKVAGSLRRFSSAYLMEDYQRFLRLERKALLEALPAEVAADPIRFAALEMATAFQAWRRMRQDQELTPDQAREVMLFVTGRILGDG